MLAYMCNLNSLTNGPAMPRGMPGPSPFGGAPVTNCRNTNNPPRRMWLGPAHRCPVPATSFSEREDIRPKKTPVWFALDESRPLFTFSDMWTAWTDVRATEANPTEGLHRLFGFFSTEANAVVGAIHPKAMSVIPAAQEEMHEEINVRPRAMEDAAGATAGAAA